MMRSPSRLLLFATLGLTSGSIAGAQEFVAHTVDGTLPAAPLLRIAQDWSIQLGVKEPQSVSGNELIALHRVHGVRPDWPRQRFLLLTNGDRIPVVASSRFGVDDDRFLFQPDVGLEADKQPLCAVPLPYLSALILAPPDSEADPDLFLATLGDGKRDSDELLLKSGDRAAGNLKAIDTKEGLKLDVDGRISATPLEQVSVFSLSTKLQARPRAEKPHALVVFTNGGRIHFAHLQLDGTKARLRGKTLAGFELEAPVENIVAVEVHRAAATYLSEIKASNYEQTPFLGMRWPLALDRSVTGRPLRVAGQTYDKGLGIHAPARATYALGAKFRRFEATVGLDSRTGKRGQVAIRVLLDGKEVKEFGRKELTGHSEPIPVRVDAGGAHELTLVAETMNFADVQAHVNWANARLIRAKSE